MKLQNLIKESADELRERPSLFLPKILTSVIGSVWILYLLNGMEAMNLSQMITGLAFFPLVFFLGVFSPVMVAEMIKNNYTLKQGLLKTIDKSLRILITSFLLFVAMTIALLPAYIGLGASLLYGNHILLIIGVPITLIISGILIYGIYFLPIALTENSSVKSFKESFKASGESKKEVTVLVLFSFALLALTYRTTGALEVLGTIGFIVGRAISSIVSTYTVTLSPKYYLNK